MHCLLYRRTQERGGILAILGVLLLVALILLVMVWYFSPSRGAVEYTITFRDAQGLTRGDLVTLAGVEVGRVSAVDLDPDTGEATVRVRIRRAYRDQVKAPPNSSARIMREGWSYPDPRVEIVNRSGVGGALAGGERVEGLESWAATQLYLGRARAENLLKEGRSAMGDFLEMAQDELADLEEWAEEKELKQKIEKIRLDLQESGMAAGAEAKARLESAVERAREVTEELRTKGRDDVAATLEGAMIELDNRLDEWTGEEPVPARSTDAVTSPTATPIAKEPAAP